MKRRKGKQVRRQILRRLEKERYYWRVRRKILRRERRALAAGNVPSTLSKAPVLFAPAVFELFGRNRHSVLQFIVSLREIVATRKRRVILDFSRTTKMVACGTLLLLAEVKRLIEISGPRRIKCRNVLDGKVGEVLQQIGFFEAIGKRTSISPSAEDVIHWCSVAGIGAEGEKANQLVETMGDRLPPTLLSPMYRGLVEAMTNCAQHAYVEIRKDGLGLRGKGEWWMFAREQDEELTVVLCDLGIGIPRSLPLTYGNSVITEYLARASRASGVTHTDADLVKAAIEIGRSRVREAHRGKGLRDVVDVINSAGTGMLRIHSNRGCYTYRMSAGEATHQRRNYRDSIIGTLIQWTVPITA